MAIRPYLTKTECNMIIMMLIETQKDKTLEGILLARKLGGGESKDAMKQQTLRHVAKKDAIYGLGLGEDEVSSLSFPSLETAHTETPKAIIDARLNTPISSPDDIDAFTDEELMAMIEASSPSMDI